MAKKKAAKKRPKKKGTTKKRTQPKGFKAKKKGPFQNFIEGTKAEAKKVPDMLAKARDKAKKNLKAARKKAVKGVSKASKKMTAKIKAGAQKKNGIDIGATVRLYREKLGLSTTALAKKARISQAQISRLENNQQGFRSPTLITIAAALKIRPWVLFMSESERAAAEKAIGLGA